MVKINERLLNENSIIEKNLNTIAENNEGLVYINVLNSLRNFVEATMLKIYCEDTKKILSYSKENNKKGINYVKNHIKGQKYKFLKSFHSAIQIPISHTSVNEENAPRLMLKYHSKLLKIKKLIKSDYNIDLLNNLEIIESIKDKSVLEYQREVVNAIESVPETRMKYITGNRYYIKKKKSFVINNEIYYEITLTHANDNESKFNRTILFTRINILPNYAIKINFTTRNINVLGQDISVKIINQYEVAIRACEFNNYFRILHTNSNETAYSHKEYKSLMIYLTQNRLTLLDIVNLEDKEFENTKSFVHKGDIRSTTIFSYLTLARKIIKNDEPGANILAYLLYKMNNRIIRSQFWPEPCHKLNKLRLKYHCIPFDTMPFAMNPVNNTPKLFELFDSIDFSGREDEILYSKIKMNTEINGNIYMHKDKLTEFIDLETLAKSFYLKLYRNHKNNEILFYDDYLFIKNYEDDSSKIINTINKKTKEGIYNYVSFANSWLEKVGKEVDCEEKRKIIKNLFEDTKVALIYGAAGTGKTTLIKHISYLFNDYTKLFLSTTNVSIQNLRSRVNCHKSTFLTISKFLYRKDYDIEYDLLFIDESSATSNKDVIDILNNVKVKVLIFVGDTYQIESIQFGNWFETAKDSIDENSVYELTKTYRTKENELLELWDKVRNQDDNIDEYLSIGNNSFLLSKKIFEKKHDDQIILCLNYDGFYGINNINKIMQSENRNKLYEWEELLTYKVGDPILFNENNRYAQILPNNLKGKIMSIKMDDAHIEFELEVDKILTGLLSNFKGLKIKEATRGSKTLITIKIAKYSDSDDEYSYSSDKSVPFSVSYAVSIHKAQGLEYDSVKVVISNEVEEYITHNIFYTAITRAKKNLEIYWSPEVQRTILDSFSKKSKRDHFILKSKGLID